MPLAHRIHRHAPLDPIMQALAEHNRRAVEADRPDSGVCCLVACLVVVAGLMLAANAVAGVVGAAVVAGPVLGLLVFADWYDDAKIEAGVIR